MKGGMYFYRGSGAVAARSVLHGHSGTETYSTDAPQGEVTVVTWAAGERTGTTTLAEPGDLVRWVEGIELGSGFPKGAIRPGGGYRQPLRFVEMLVNNPKSLSVVATQNPAVATALDRVLERQADEIARYLSSVAVTRIGPKGAQREVGGLTVETARVMHRTSRAGDPYAHIRLMLNTRVKTPDDTWHALHSAAIRQHIGAVHERGHRVLVTDPALRRVLAREGYTLGVDGEINEARKAVGLLSKRARAIGQKCKRIEAEWREAHPGTEPTQRVLNGWRQQAWAEDRSTKPSGLSESPEVLAERVRAELAGAGFDFITRRAPVEAVWVTVGQVARDQLAEEAVAVLSAAKSTWSIADLTATVEAAVSRSGVVGDPQSVSELVEDVAARAASRCVSVLDPVPHTPTSMSRHLTSEALPGVIA